MPPAVVCAKVHACKNSTDVAEKIAKFIEKSEKAPEDASCGLCELVVRYFLTPLHSLRSHLPFLKVSSVEQWLASNQTQAQIEQNLENVCNALPGGISSLVRTLLTTLMQVLLRLLTPLFRSAITLLSSTSLWPSSGSLTMSLPKLSALNWACAPRNV
jgi:hypothetical protein